MNWFAIAVTVLQYCAAVKYMLDGQRVDAVFWFCCATANVAIISKR